MTPKARKWRRKYYPAPARRVRKKDALDHAERKWMGLRPAVLWKYGLRVYNRDIYDENDNLVLEVNGQTCAPCLWFKCTTCPITVAGGSCGGDSGLYCRWGCTGDPEPMIRLLRKAKRMQAAAEAAKGGGP